MTPNKIILIVLPLVFSSFMGNDKSFNEYSELVKREQQALRSTVGKVNVYDLTGRKDCNKTRIKYLGVVRTKKGKSYKILTSFFVFSAAATCHGSSSIKIFDMRNRYLGEYDMRMPENLPDGLRDNKLIFLRDSEDCNMKTATTVDLRSGLPKRFFMQCSENDGDTYDFRSY